MTSTVPFAYSSATPSLSLEAIMHKEKPKKRVGPIGTAIVAAQIALQSLFGVAPAKAQEYQADAVAQQSEAIPFHYAVAAAANAPGANGSF